MKLLLKSVVKDNQKVDILIDKGRFLKIAPSIEDRKAEILDCSAQAILPSFHNSHTHAAMNLLRGYADDMELHSWLNDYIWPMEQNLMEEDVYNGARLACLEMIKSGTTFFTDMYWHIHQTAKAVEEMGMRAALGDAFIDMGDVKKGMDYIYNFKHVLASAKQYSDRINFIISPHALYTVSPQALQAAAEIALENEIVLHLHLSETETEVQNCLKEHKMRPLEFLEKIGVLFPKVLAAHVIHVNDKEIEIIRRHNFRVAHCPVSNMKLSSGAFPYKKLADITLLATDSASSNNNLDMQEEMKIAALRAKHDEKIPDSAKAEEVFEMATERTASFFGIKSGKIEEGWNADCILVNLDHHRLNPGFNLISDMVYSANSECIDTTICAGKILMRNRKVDKEEEIIAMARESKQRMQSRLKE